jgi:hypothetical protein
MRPLGLPRLALAALACLPLSAVAEPVAYGAGFRDLYRVDLATGQYTSKGWPLRVWASCMRRWTVPVAVGARRPIS